MEIFKLFVKFQFFYLILLFSNSKGCEDNINISDVNNLIQSKPSTPRLIKIGKSLLSMNVEIKALRASIKTSLNINMFEKFTEISNNLEALEIKINDQKKTEKYTVYTETLNLLWKFYYTLDDQMLKIRKYLECIAKDFNLNGAIQAIKEQRFNDAEEILNFIDNDSKFISLMVHEIYTNNTGYVTILLDFVKSLSTINRSLLIIQNLKKEADSIEQFDLIMTVDILGILEKEILTQELTHGIQYNDAKNLHDNLMIVLKNNSINTLTSKMISKTFKTNERIKIFLEHLYNFNDELSNEIIFEVIDKVYEKIPSNELIDNIYAQCYIPQKEDALVYIYEKLRDTKKLNSVIFKLAKYVYHMKNSKYSEKIINAKRHKNFDTIWNGLPTIVQTLFTERYFCIKNTLYSEYLYAASDGFKYDDESRRVFTWMPKKKIFQGVWEIQKGLLENEEIYFFNKDHSEYLYASEENIFMDTHLKYVFTKKIEDYVNRKEVVWNLLMDGDKLRIKSVSNNDLLCITSAEYSTDRRKVFTIYEESTYADSNCTWDLEACDNILIEA